MDGTSPSPPNHRRHGPRRSHGSSFNEIRDSDAAARRSPSPEPGLTTQQLLRRNSLGSSQDSKPASTKTKALPTRRRAHFLKNWWLEIGACFIFILALIAIIITLRPHQDKPLPQWPYNISVNSLISIYVVILKGAVLLVTAEGLGQLKWRWFKNDRPLEDIVSYDSASRGPLGALKLLWQLRLRHPLSSCGALITILMLVIDPFAQQIIRYYGCDLVVQGQEATIPRTNLYISDGTHIGAGLINIPPDLQSAINAGIFSPGGGVTPGCPTGNCSFTQPYSTIGYCGGCKDITNDLKFIFENSSTSDSGAASGFTRSAESMLSYLPSGTSINSTGALTTNEGTASNSVWNLATMNSTINMQSVQGNGQENELELIVAQNPYYRDPVSAPLSSALNETCQSGSDTWQCKGYGAASCTMYPCVRTYKASVSTGSFHETWISDSTAGIWGFSVKSHGASSLYYLATVDTECLNPFERSSLASEGYVIDPNARWLSYNLTFDPTIVSNSSYPSSMLAHGCLYAFDLFLDMSLWNSYLGYFFNGTINGAMDENGKIDHINGPQNLQTIYNYGNISFDRVNSTFHNISDTMTTFVRQTGHSNQSKPALGAVIHNDTCLEVRWGWLALPAFLVLLTVIFFAAMVIETRPTGERAQIWKSSPLAFIFHGLEDPNRLHQNRPLEEVSDMEHTARGITVRLTTTDRGVNFVTVGDEGSGEKGMEGRV